VAARECFAGGHMHVTNVSNSACALKCICCFRSRLSLVSAYLLAVSVWHTTCRCRCLVNSV